MLRDWVDAVIGRDGLSRADRAELAAIRRQIDALLAGRQELRGELDRLSLDVEVRLTVADDREADGRGPHP